MKIKYSQRKLQKKCVDYWITLSKHKKNRKKKMSRKLKGKWDSSKKAQKIRILDPFGDFDKDGVLNFFDCQPFNPKEHGIWSRAKSTVSSTVSTVSKGASKAVSTGKEVVSGAVSTGKEAVSGGVSTVSKGASKAVSAGKDIKTAIKSGVGEIDKEGAPVIEKVVVFEKKTSPAYIAGKKATEVSSEFISGVKEGYSKPSRGGEFKEDIKKLSGIPAYKQRKVAEKELEDVIQLEKEYGERGLIEQTSEGKVFVGSHETGTQQYIVEQMAASMQPYTEDNVFRSPAVTRVEEEWKSHIKETPEGQVFVPSYELQGQKLSVQLNPEAQEWESQLKTTSEDVSHKLEEAEQKGWVRNGKIYYPDTPEGRDWKTSYDEAWGKYQSILQQREKYLTREGHFKEKYVVLTPESRRILSEADKEYKRYSDDMARAIGIQNAQIDEYNRAILKLGDLQRQDISQYEKLSKGYREYEVAQKEYERLYGSSLLGKSVSKYETTQAKISPYTMKVIPPPVSFTYATTPEGYIESIESIRKWTGASPLSGVEKEEMLKSWEVGQELYSKTRKMFGLPPEPYRWEKTLAKTDVSIKAGIVEEWREKPLKAGIITAAYAALPSVLGAGKIAIKPLATTATKAFPKAAPWVGKWGPRVIGAGLTGVYTVGVGERIYATPPEERAYEAGRIIGGEVIPMSFGGYLGYKTMLSPIKAKGLGEGYVETYKGIGIGPEQRPFIGVHRVTVSEPAATLSREALVLGKGTTPISKIHGEIKYDIPKIGYKIAGTTELSGWRIGKGFSYDVWRDVGYGAKITKGYIPEFTGEIPVPFKHKTPKISGRIAARKEPRMITEKAGQIPPDLPYKLPARVQIRGAKPKIPIPQKAGVKPPKIKSPWGIEVTYGEIPTISEIVSGRLYTYESIVGKVRVGKTPKVFKTITIGKKAMKPEAKETIWAEIIRRRRGIRMTVKKPTFLKVLKENKVKGYLPGATGIKIGKSGIIIDTPGGEEVITEFLYGQEKPSVKPFTPTNRQVIIWSKKFAEQEKLLEEAKSKSTIITKEGQILLSETKVKEKGELIPQLKEVTVTKTKRPVMTKERVKSHFETQVREMNEVRMRQREFLETIFKPEVVTKQKYIFAPTTRIKEEEKVKAIGKEQYKQFRQFMPFEMSKVAQKEKGKYGLLPLLGVRPMEAVKQIVKPITGVSPITTTKPVTEAKPIIATKPIIETKLISKIPPIKTPIIPPIIRPPLYPPYKEKKAGTKKGRREWEWLEEFTVQRPTELHFGAIESGIPKISKVVMLPKGRKL